MNNTYYQNLSQDELFDIEGGSTFGNLCIAAGSVILIAASGPPAWIAGGACIAVGFAHSQGW